MTIYEGSRYETAVVVPVREAKGDVRPAIYVSAEEERQHFSFTTYIVKGGDRLDTIAGSIYGNAELWWILANANPEVFYPESLPFGTVLRIPYPSDVL